MARPRSEQAHNAALDATIEVMLEEGVEGVTLEEVAARSGVAKSTLYRHFGSKEGLVAKAVRCCVIEHPTPDTGDLAQDLEHLFARYAEVEEDHQFNQLFPMLVEAAGRESDLQEVLDEVLAERRRPIRTVLQLAQLRGEIGPDIDLDAAMALIIGPFTYRKMVERAEVTPEFADLVLRGAVAALRATAAAPA